MRLVPTGNTELNLNNRWVFEKYLELIEQFACDPDGFGSSGPGLEDAVELIRLAVVRKDRKAEDESILARMRVEVRELWQDFRELTLLGELLRRAALREVGCSSPGGTDPPSCREALRLARALVADIPGRSLRADAQGEDYFGLEWESAEVPGSGRPVAARRHLQDPAKVHQTIRVQPELLQRPRAHLGRVEAAGQYHTQQALWVEE